jgi:hypothetical protein
VVFHNFPWGTSIREFTARVGKPGLTEEFNGLTSLVYQNITISGYPVYMLAYFSKNGLEGGMYYFDNFGLEEVMKCYTEMQNELLAKFGPTNLQTIFQGQFDPAEVLDPIRKEPRLYETSWNLKNGYVYLKVNTRLNEPVTLWFSSPALTSQMRGSAEVARER